MLEYPDIPLTQWYCHLTDQNRQSFIENHREGYISEHDTIRFLRAFVITPEEHQQMDVACVTLLDLLRGTTPGAYGEWIDKLFARWNERLGATVFRF